MERGTASFRCVLSGGCWQGEAGGGLTRSGAPTVVVGECISLSLAGPELELGVNKGSWQLPAKAWLRGA